MIDDAKTQAQKETNKIIRCQAVILKEKSMCYTYRKEVVSISIMAEKVLQKRIWMIKKELKVNLLNNLLNR